MTENCFVLKSTPMTTSLDKWLAGPCQLTAYQLDPLPGDASFRRYFRVREKDRSYIAMDAAVEKNSCVPFVTIANALRTQGLNAPDIFASDFEQGFLLLSDFGHRMYLDELNPTNGLELYRHALDALLMMRQCKIELKPFTKEFMRQELELFKEWFLEKHLALALTDSTNKILATCFDFLAETASRQPYVFMHRDFHSANLMILPENGVGILDFQDAFIGPETYDLVSLLRDCYIAWPESMVQELVHYFWENLSFPKVSFDVFMQSFDLMGMQRHLKALLTFSRKYRRDNNANYLRHIPRTLNYILTISGRYVETAALHQFLTDVVVEKCVE